MNIFEKLLPDNLYHTYVVHGDILTLPDELLAFLKDKKYIEESSPDVFVGRYESFGAGDMGQIKDWHNQKGLGGKRICIISTKFINREAEQSLLKMLEEPGENAHFFLMIPSSVVLLDTILSRSHVIYTGQVADDIESIKFMKMSAKDRIEYIGTLIKDHEDDDNSGGLRHSAINIINGVEASLHKGLQKNYKDKNLQFTLEELQNARSYLSTPGASVKMILEHIAVVV
ncbi:MAG: hypothetical protein WCK91_01140 [bacterium]